MISKKNRFHGRHTIINVFKKGKTEKSEHFSLKYFSNNQETYRAAVVVSKKVSKLAVERNKIRRKIYENVRLIMEQQKNASGVDMVFTVYDQQINQLKPDQLTKQIENTLKKAEII